MYVFFCGEIVPIIYGSVCKLRGSLIGNNDTEINLSYNNKSWKREPIRQIKEFYLLHKNKAN